MSYRDWHIGMKVVCVDAGWHGGGYQSKKGIPCPLVVDKVYEIEAIFPGGGVFNGNPAPIDIVLRGVRKAGVSGPFDDVSSHAFNASRVRRVQPRKTDISCFTDMLKHIDAPMQKELS